MKADFELFPVDQLLRGPGNRNAGAGCGHHDNVALGAPLEITDVSVMRQNFWPQLQIGSRFENGLPGGVHNNGIAFVHEEGVLGGGAERISSPAGIATKGTNFGAGNERHLREVRETNRTERGGVHLHLRMHLLSRMRGGDAAGLSELRWRTG